MSWGVRGTNTNTGTSVGTRALEQNAETAGDGRGYFIQGAGGAGVLSEKVAFKQMCESSTRLIM